MLPLLTATTGEYIGRKDSVATCSSSTKGVFETASSSVLHLTIMPRGRRQDTHLLVHIIAVVRRVVLRMVPVLSEALQ